MAKVYAMAATTSTTPTMVKSKKPKPAPVSAMRRLSTTRLCDAPISVRFAPSSAVQAIGNRILDCGTSICLHRRRMTGTKNEAAATMLTKPDSTPGTAVFANRSRL